MKPLKHDYGLILPKRVGQRALHAFAYLTEHPTEEGGLGPYEHFRRYIGMTWPRIVEPESWHPWLEWRMQVFCDPVLGVKRHTQFVSEHNRTITTRLYRHNIWGGCAASGKSYDLAMFALAWWSVLPQESAVLLCSTSKLMVRRRAWANLQAFYHDAVDTETGKRVELGYMLDSQTTLCYRKGDMKHAIMALAVEPGELQASIGKAKGIHAKRIMVAVDEADASPAAILELVNNWRKGCDEFVILAAANCVSPLDAHGQLSEPAAGWDSVTVDSDTWITKGVDKWSVDPGIALHFDGEKSPNVRAGRTKWPYLYSYEDWLSAKARPEYHQSIQYWSMDRGWWAPEGAMDRVVTPQQIVRHKGRERFTWTRRSEPCAALDPAFGGNTCFLQFGTVGDSTLDKNVLELDQFVEILPSATSDLPVDVQIARRTIQECKFRGVAPDHFGMDCTGTGRGVAAIIAMEWSNQFVRVEFGGQASQHILSTDSPETARDVYANRVTELWFRVALLLKADKLRGLHQRACQELCARPFKRQGRRIVVDPKEKMKELQGKSPDCFIAGTLVKTARGNKPIDDLVTGDLVATPFGFSPVVIVHCIETSMSRTRLLLSDGTLLEGLSNHRVFTRKTGWVELDACSIDTELESVYSRPLWKILNLLFTRAGNTGFKAQADTIKTDATTNLSAFFTVEFGSTTMGRFLMGMWSTILTGTGAIMTLATSHLCIKQSTGGITGKSCERMTPSEPSKIMGWCLLEKPQKPGTLLQKGWNGISSMAGKYFENFFPRKKLSLAVSVGNHSLDMLPDHQSSVQINARNNTRCEKQIGSRLEFAVSAVVNSVATILNRRKRVVAKTVVWDRYLAQRVFCVTLEKENAFYANGVLVENCADACAVLVEVARQLGVLPGGEARKSAANPRNRLAELANEAWAETGSSGDRITEPDPNFGVGATEQLSAELKWTQ